MRAASERDRRYPAINQSVKDVSEGLALIRSVAEACLVEVEDHHPQSPQAQDLAGFAENSLKAAVRCEELLAEDKHEIVWNVFFHFGIHQKRGVER